MPRQPQWYLRVPEALKVLSDFPAPVLDRAALEQLLGLGRRDAIRFLHRFGGYPSGGALVIPTPQLRAALESVARGDSWQWETRRHAKVSELVSEMRQEWTARQVVLPAVSAGIPETVRLAPGRLEITFEGALDLLGQLLRLTRAMSEDYQHFERLLEVQDADTPTDLNT